jgi:hypothetical protein
MVWMRFEESRCVLLHGICTTSAPPAAKLGLEKPNGRLAPPA